MTKRIQLDSDDIAFFEDCVERQEEGCWWWHGIADGAGRGQMRIGGARIAAHRVAWVIERRESLLGRDRLHRECPCPTCINPDHHQRRRGSPPSDENGTTNGRYPDILPPLFEPRLVKYSGIGAANAERVQTSDRHAAVPAQMRDLTAGEQQYPQPTDIATISDNIGTFARRLADLFRLSVVTSQRLAAIEVAIFGSAHARDRAAGARADGIRGDVAMLVRDVDRLVSTIDLALGKQGLLYLAPRRQEDDGADEVDDPISKLEEIAKNWR